MKEAVQSAMRLKTKGVKSFVAEDQVVQKQLEQKNIMKAVFHYIRLEVIQCYGRSRNNLWDLWNKVWIKRRNIIKDPYASEKTIDQGVLDNEHVITKKTKFRKQFKGRIHGSSKGNYALNYGSFGLRQWSRKSYFKTN